MFDPLKKLKDSYDSFTGKTESVDVNDIFPGQPSVQSTEQLIAPSVSKEYFVLIVHSHSHVYHFIVFILFPVI